jgi:hypothetical protein
MGRTDCTEPQCLYSRAKSVLPLWTIRPVQSLSACTVELYLYSPYGPYGHVQNFSALTVELYLYSHYGPYGLYRASVPVQGCTLYLPLQMFFEIPKKLNLVQHKHFSPASEQHQIVYLMKTFIRGTQTVLHLSEDTLCSFCLLFWTQTSLRSCRYSTT